MFFIENLNDKIREMKMEPTDKTAEDAKTAERKHLIAEFFTVATIIYPADDAEPVDEFTYARAKRRYWELIHALSELPLAE